MASFMETIGGSLIYETGFMRLLYASVKREWVFNILADGHLLIYPEQSMSAAQAIMLVDVWTAQKRALGVGRING